MDSIQVTESKSSALQSPQPKQVRITDVEITDENVALNIIVGFLEVAHKKGAYSFEESAKIWECIKKFQVANK
jgi:hypothetical protein